MPKKIIIYGISAYAEIMHYKFDKYSDYTVIAFCVDQEYIKDEYFVDCLFCHLKILIKPTQ